MPLTVSSLSENVTADIKLNFDRFFHVFCPPLHVLFKLFKCYTKHPKLDVIRHVHYDFHVNRSSDSL